MQIIVTIRTGNAAMQTWGDIADTLTDIADTIIERHDRDDEPRDGQQVAALDVNGNRVGRLVTIEDR